MAGLDIFRSLLQSIAGYFFHLLRVDPEQYIANLTIDRTSSMKPSVLFHILLVTSLIALAVPSYAGAVSASTTYVPGVKVGDWWNYGNFKFVGPAINIT